MDGLEGKRVVITGGASGIGAATARRFLAEAASVVVLDSNGDALMEIRRALPALVAGEPSGLPHRATISASRPEEERA